MANALVLEGGVSFVSLNCWIWAVCTTRNFVSVCSWRALLFACFYINCGSVISSWMMKSVFYQFIFSPHKYIYNGEQAHELRQELVCAPPVKVEAIIPGLMHLCLHLNLLVFFDNARDMSGLEASPCTPRKLLSSLTHKCLILLLCWAEIDCHWYFEKEVNMWYTKYAYRPSFGVE